MNGFEKRSAGCDERATPYEVDQPHHLLYLFPDNIGLRVLVDATCGVYQYA
jgi:hypothetical protein